MRIYEEYATHKEKRQAQHGAKLARATGKARGYLFVFDEDGINYQGQYNAIGETFELEPGEGPRALTTVYPTAQHLRLRCRRIKWDDLPEAWKQAFAAKLDDCLSESVAELAAQRKRYSKIIKCKG